MAGRPGAIAHLSAAALLSMSSVRATERRQMRQLGSDSVRSEQRCVFQCRCTQGALRECNAGTLVGGAHGDHVWHGHEGSVSSVNEDR
eukprot:5469889-Pleurochrysis_carterae.AAC.1